MKKKYIEIGEYREATPNGANFNLKANNPALSAGNLLGARRCGAPKRSLYSREIYWMVRYKMILIQLLADTQEGGKVRP